MRLLAISIIVILILTGCNPVQQSERIKLNTICNPVDISYRFGIDEPSRREAADPTIVWFRDRYYLFASKSGGYWQSKDLTGWNFIQTSEIPVEEYAPTAIAINDKLYFLASSTEKSTIYESTNPHTGEWSVAKDSMEIPVWDPAFFLDDDSQLYLYWGCSNENPLYGVAMDYTNNFSFIDEPVELKHADPEQFGWEVPGDYNTLVNQRPWIEGVWMNKHNGKYYLQYSGPGTEYKSYSDAVYISDNALGPFSCQTYNPFAYKPEGFTAGAGHGCTFADKFGNYWHIGTITISQKHIFERRLGLFPAFFDEQGTMFSITKFGDYPLIIPRKKISDFKEIFPGWMLLSFAKEVIVSSSIDSLPALNMTDENIRTYWAAESGNKGEFAIIDLRNTYDIYAVQVNFAEHNTSLFGRNKDRSHRYVIESSDDNQNWKMLIDQSKNEEDNTHDYTQLSNKRSCRYLKITNIEVPGGNFAISGFRVFGKGAGDVPGKISKFKAQRNPDNRRSVNLTWNESSNATGYNINFGTDREKLYQSYMVYRDTALTINVLNTNVDYYFSIESFNENGITSNDQVIFVE